MRKWEYEYVELGSGLLWTQPMLELFNKMGADGWEFTGSEEPTRFGKKFLFKRGVPADIKMEALMNDAREVLRGSTDEPPEMSEGDDPRVGKEIERQI